MENRGLQCDFLVIGGGIAGASIAYHLCDHGKVLLLEMEEYLGYHSTSRSAALYAQSYGNRVIRALNVASGDFLRNPPQGFTEHPLIQPRGVLMLAREDQLENLHVFFNETIELSPKLKWIDKEEAIGMIPSLRKDYFSSAVLKAVSMYIRSTPIKGRKISASA